MQSSSRISKLIRQKQICASLSLMDTPHHALTILNSRISTPRTKYSPEPIDTVPSYGLELMKQVIGGLFPELADIGFTDSRVCG